MQNGVLGLGVGFAARPRLITSALTHFVLKLLYILGMFLNVPTYKLHNYTLVNNKGLYGGVFFSWTEVEDVKWKSQHWQESGHRRVVCITKMATAGYLDKWPWVSQKLESLK